MIKKTVSVFLLILLLTIFSFSVYAQPPRVNDNASFLTEEETSKLEAFLSEKRSEDLFDIVILTEDYVDDLESYADDFYDVNGYGVGDNRDGLLLLVTNYGCFLSTCGMGIDAIEPYMGDLSSDFHVDVDEGGYYFAFTNFTKSVSACVNFERDRLESDFFDEDEYDFSESYDEYYEDDVPVEIILQNIGGANQGVALKRYIVITLLSLLSGLIGAGVVVSGMKRKHRSVRAKADANDFVVRGSLVLDSKYDRLVSRNVTRTPKPDDDMNNMNDMNNHGSTGGFSGGGPTHISSSGVTHGGGAF